MITMIAIGLMIVGLSGMAYSARRHYRETHNTFRARPRPQPRPPRAALDHDHVSLIGRVLQ